MGFLVYISFVQRINRCVQRTNLVFYHKYMLETIILSQNQRCNRLLKEIKTRQMMKKVGV